MTNQPQWWEEFDKRFIPKTFDSYQGWSIDDLEEVRNYVKEQRESSRLATIDECVGVLIDNYGDKFVPKLEALKDIKQN